MTVTCTCESAGPFRCCAGRDFCPTDECVFNYPVNDRALPIRVQRLHLERDQDVSGVSGVGTVAYGALFPDGTIVLRWDTKVRSTVLYDSIQDLIEIVGHGGMTRVVLDD